MDDSFARREACRPRRVSAGAEFGANAKLQDGEVVIATHGRKPQPAPRRLSSATGRMDRRLSAPQVVHQRHMPMQPNKFHIPRKNKEKKALFQFVSTESREYDDMKTILTSSYMDTNSAGCFTYSNPRLVHSELLEKEFVEKRKEMKADGRTEKELEESYCFLLTPLTSLPILCEKGLTVGQSRITVLGDPGKGVYLSRYSDLLQMNPLSPGTTGEIIIVKVLKGKVKSFYENMKTVQDPTPNFDSHIAKNACKVTSLTCYRAFELTQQYFYEYSLAELLQRPRQVCPFAVISFQFKGKDASLPTKPNAPIRSISQLSERSKEFGPFTVWTGDLVKNKRVLLQASLRSSSTPCLPHRLPEKLDVGYLMRFDRVAKLIPSGLSYNLYNSSKEVVTEGHYCSLLEVTDRNRSTVNVTRLLQELETKRVVLVSPLTERGFLFLLSSVQMAEPSERGETWKRCLQALFVFPEPRDVSRFASRCTSSSHEPVISDVLMPRLNEFVPALHHALIKARANPPSNLSASVELQTREYLSTLSDNSVQQYPMNEYKSKLDEEGKEFPPPPKHHRVNMDSYVKSYLSNPILYLLPVARARQVLKEHRGPKQPQETVHSGGGQKEATGNNREGPNNDQKMQQLLDLILTCKRNAEIEVKREGGDMLKAPKRKMDQETAERALKYFKASQDTGRHEKVPAGGNRDPSSPISFASVTGLLGLRDVDLREHGSELTAKFMRQLKGLIKTANQSICEPQEEGPKDCSPFGLLATKLGLPANCDIDLRKQEELEEQTGGSVSSLEGFSPGSHSGEANHHGAAGRGGGGLGRKMGAYEEEKDDWEIPWVLIPITGLSSERYSQRDKNLPQDPRFQHVTVATSITTTTKPAQKCPTLSPEHSSSPSTIQFQSPDPSPPASPSQCPSPDPSPPASPSQCPSPDPSLPASPSQCPSPDPSPPPSPSECPSPLPSPPNSPAQSMTPETSSTQTSSQCRSLKPNELNPLKKNHSGANEPRSAPTVLKEFPEESGKKEMKHQGNKIIKEEASFPADMNSFHIPGPEFKFKPSPPLFEPVKEVEGGTRRVEEVKAKSLEVQPCKKEQKRSDEEGEKFRHIKSEEEEMMIEVPNEQKREVQEPEGGSALLPSVSSHTACPHRDIDSIVDKHVGDFTSDLQLLLQEESDNCSFSHSLNTVPSTSELTLPRSSLSSFSHYVSLFNPCPPVQNYVSSLKDSISCMLAEFDESWPRHQANSSRTDVEATLAKRISDFVSSFRAASAETGRDHEDFPLCSEQTAADVEPSVSQGLARSTAEEICQPEDTNWSPPSPQPSSSDPTSPFGSTYKPENLLEISRTITQNIREVHDNHKLRTVEEEAGGNCIVTVPCYSGVSDMPAEPSHLEPTSSPSPAFVLDSDSKPVPSTTHLSSVINQLNPEVLNSLVEIAKDIKRKSQQFYIHCTEPGDPVYEEVKEHLLKLGNVQQSPVDFLQQENSENGLLVIIKNRDVAGNIHKIPSLMALKRHSSVVFVGIDSLDDIRNNSCIELFVSGGCVVSDEFLFNPDVITHSQLSALLMLLEQHSSPESVWRWKIHCKTHKKLKEQARFRKDAAKLLDVLSTYQKRQIIEFLPYHHCDMSTHQSPDLNCLIELQARYTQFRHTIYLTEHHFEKFPAYLSEGIITASVEEILQNFSELVGCHNIRDKQLLVEDLLAPKGHSRQLSHQDSVTGSTSPEHTPPISSSNQVLPQPSSTLSFLPHVSDQIVPDAFCKDSLSQTTSRDMKFLQQAIRQLRAQRLEQQKLLKQQQLLLEMQVEASSSLIPNPAGSESPPLVHEEPTEPVQLMPGRKAVAAIQEPIHSVLQPELWQKPRGEDRQQQPPTEAGGRRGSPEGDKLGDQREITPLRAVGLQTEHWTFSKSESSTHLSSLTAPAVTEQSNQTEPSSDRSAEETGQRGEPEAGRDAATAEDSSSRDTQLTQEQPLKAEFNPQSSISVDVKKIPVVIPREFKPALIQQHPQQLSLPVLPPQQGVPLLQPPSMAPFHSQPFHPRPLLRPLSALGGLGSLMGPTHPWPGGLAPTGAPLVWGLQQTGVDFLERYYGSAGPGSDMYRGTRPGGGFNRM